MTPSGIITLHHGTTRKRAEQIAAGGPDPNYVEPGALFYDRAEAFSTNFAGAKDIGLSIPAMYALAKAGVYHDEGGPVILEIEVPAEVVQLALGDIDLRHAAASGDIRFDAKSGLTELIRVWPTLAKRVLPL